MTARSVDVILRQFRFELTAFAAVLLTAAGLGIVVLVRLPGLNDQLAACASGSVGVGCRDLVDDAGRMQSLGGLVPVVASLVGAFGGIVLGVAVVGREVERGTAALAWPLARSRRRWLAMRVVVVGTALGIAALVPSLVAELLVPVLHPGNVAASSFIGFETRGLLPVGRDLAAFGLGVLAGAAFGRVLPGLLLALILSVAGGLGLAAAVGAWRSADAVVLAVDPAGDGSAYDVNLIVDYRYRDASGRLLSGNDLYAQLPNGEVPPGWPDSSYQQVIVGIPGARRPEIDRREAALFGLVAVLLVALSAVVVERRRPY